MGFEGLRGPELADLPARCRPRPTGVLHRPAALCEPSRPAFEGPKAGAVLWETGALKELASGFVERGDG